MRTQLCLAVALASGCALDDEPPTSTDESADSVFQWTDDVQIPGQNSSYQVGLAGFGSRLFMIHVKGGDTGLFLSNLSGASWSSRTALPMHADYGPAMTVFQNRPTVVYHSAGENRLLMSSSFDGFSWLTPRTAGTSLGTHKLKNAPAIAVHRDNLYVAYCEMTNGPGTQRLHVDRFDGGTWTTATTYPIRSGSGCIHAAIASLPDGRLDVIWTVEREPDWKMFEASATGADVTWNPEHELTAMKSTKPPAIVTCGGKTHLVHGGFANPLEIWWSELQADGTWSTNLRVPDQASDGGAALGCLNGSLAVMVHNGGYSDLWWSDFGP